MIYNPKSAMLHKVLSDIKLRPEVKATTQLTSINLNIPIVHNKINITEDRTINKELRIGENVQYINPNKGLCSKDKIHSDNVNIKKHALNIMTSEHIANKDSSRLGNIRRLPNIRANNANQASRPRDIMSECTEVNVKHQSFDITKNTNIEIKDKSRLGNIQSKHVSPGDGIQNTTRYSNMEITLTDEIKDTSFNMRDLHSTKHAQKDIEYTKHQDELMVIIYNNL